MSIFDNPIKRAILNLTIDIVCIFFGFLVGSFFKHIVTFSFYNIMLKEMFLFMIISVIVSIFTQKYETRCIETKFAELLRKYINSWLISVAITVFILFMVNYTPASRIILIFTLFLVSITEVIGISILFFFRNAVIYREQQDIEHIKTIKEAIEKTGSQVENEVSDFENELSNIFFKLEEEVDIGVYEFIKSVYNNPQAKVLFLFTTNRFNILQHKDASFDVVINVARVNNMRFINKFFETVNIKLKDGGIYFQCADTLIQRKKRFYSKYPPGIAHFLYFLDFIFHRVIPKLPYIKVLYFQIFKGKRRRISFTETLGRLYSCGFELIKTEEIDGLQWFAVRKVSPPLLPKNVTYGPLIKLERIGKNGKIIKVYKLRTMHPYSEFLQKYIYETNNLAEGGKIKDDFRVSTLGKYLRKFWIDEIPMLINVFKGEMKIVGVRPLSKHFFSLYPPDLQEKRTKYKPGLIPPFYADLPKTFEEILESECKYLEQYEKYGFLTDIKYFFLALFNIIFRRARSA